MAEVRVERRLAAIFAADVAGYSRLMGQDEVGTLARLRTLRRELIDPKVAEHKGRVVKTTGDGMLIEFPSVVEAVACAVEVQGGMADHNAAIAAERRIEFRVGINLGDVIVEGDDIHGDGVNVAARLEALADPGGVCVSRVVWDQVRDKLDVAFADLGEQSFKNIARPVWVYALRSGSSAAAVASAAAAILQPLVAPRLSIVVLPFTNLGNDPEQQYFADGITEDLTADLSRLLDMFVISRNTAFTYQGKRVDTKQIGRELGIRYVLEGSVRRFGNRVRINAQVIDAESDAHLWADRFDGDMGDLFALQDEVTSRISVALDLELIGAEAKRPTEHPDALDYTLRGRAALNKGPGRQKYAEAISFFEQALALDPRSVEALSHLARTLMARVMNGWADSTAADIARAEELAGQALAASPRSPMAHVAKGQVLRAQHRFAEAIPEYEMAIAVNRNWAGVLRMLAQCKLFTGSIDEVIALEEQAMRLSPRDSNIYSSYLEIGGVHLLQSRIDEAIVWLEKARNANPDHPSPHARLASAYALKGETERAAAELTEARRLASDSRFSSLSRLKAAPGYWGAASVSALFEPTLIAGLRKAGMPEE